MKIILFVALAALIGGLSIGAGADEGHPRDPIRIDDIPNVRHELPVMDAANWRRQSAGKGVRRVPLDQ